MNNKKSFKRLQKILLVQITLLIGLMTSITTTFANPVVNITGSETAEAVPEPVEIEKNTEAIEQEKLKDVKDEIMQGEQPSDGEQVTQEETAQVQESTDTPEIAVQATTDESNFNFDASTGTIISLSQNCTLSDIVIPKQIGGVDVTAIGDNAFLGFTTITSISFEDGNKVTKIGNNAFKNMTSLTSIVLPSGLTSIGASAFKSTGISSIVLPSGVTSIGKSAFEYTGISSIVIPNGVTSIPQNCFCVSKLTSVTLGDKVTSIGDSAFSYTALTDIKLPNTLKTIEGYAFYNTKLSTITIPDSVIDMGSGVFKSCSNLKSVKLSKNLKTLESGMFDSCQKLESLELPDGLESIGREILKGVPLLHEITIPSSVNTIESSAFNGSSLEKIDIPSKTAGSISDAPWGRQTAIVIWKDTIIVKDSSNNDKYVYDSSTKTLSKYLGSTSNDIIDIKKDFQDFGLNDEVEIIGENAFYNSSNISSIKIPDSVTQIKNKAFYDCQKITSISIPDTVTIMGERAFSNCGSLKSITIGTGLSLLDDSVFSGCSSLEDITIPNNIKKIGSNVFSGCSKLKSIKIPDTVTEMGSYAFYGCSSLNNIKIGTGLSLLDIGVFQGCTSLEDITIPYNIKRIRYYVFSNCSKLKFIRIPDRSKDSISGKPWDAPNASVIWKGTMLVPEKDPKYVYEYDENTKKGVITKYIGNDADVNIEQDFKSLGKPVTEIDNNAFAGNATLKKVVVPSSVTKLGTGAFYNSTLLESVSLPDSLTGIGTNCFSYCGKLINVNIPGNLKSIGSRAFSGCNSIQSIELPETVNVMGEGVFSYCKSLKNVKLPRSLIDIPSDTFLECSLLQTFNFPDSIESIGGSAFMGCDQLKKVEIPDTVTSIGVYAFEGCNQLKKVEIPDTVTSIGVYAFANCNNLMEVKLPNNLKVIAQRSFSGCSKLTSINFPDKLNSIVEGAFSGTSLTGTLILPTTVKFVAGNAFGNVTTLDKLIIPYARVKCPYVGQHPYGLNENNPTQIVYGGGVPNIKARVTPTKDSTGKKKYLLDFDIDFRDKDGNVYDAITRINLPDETGELSGNIIHVGQRESWSTADNNKTLDVTQRAVYKIQIAGLDNELHDYEILLGKIELENNEAEFYLGDMKTLTMNQILYRLGIIDKDGHTLIKDEFGVSVDCTYKISDEQMNAIHNMQYGDKLETKIGIHDPLLQKDYDISINVVSNVIRGKVVWDDNDNRKGLRPSSVNVNLYSKKENSLDAEKLVTTKAVTEDTDGNWSFSFEEASPWENKNVGGVVGTFHCGDELKYTISPTIPTYYSMEIKENPSNFFTITLTVDQIPVTGIIEGSNGKVLIGLSIGLLILSSAYFVIKKHRKIIKK